MPTRRHLLVVAGLAATGSGCMGVLGSEDEEPSEPAEGENESDAPEGAVRLGELDVQNNSSEPQQVQLAIEADGELLHLETYEFDEETSNTSVEGPWGDEPANYRIHASLSDDEDAVETADVAEGMDDETECVRALVRVDDGGRLGVWTGSGCNDSGF